MHKNCPRCGAALENDDGYSRVLGIEIPAAYDGTLYWMCPYCGGCWHRWPKGHDLRSRAEWYMTPIHGDRDDYDT